MLDYVVSDEGLVSFRSNICLITYVVVESSFETRFGRHGGSEGSTIPLDPRRGSRRPRALACFDPWVGEGLDFAEAPGSRWGRKVGATR
ncbi:MAG: hypothetical protein JWO24_3505 [Rhodospirillales bacterium]|nr:hypothetical protein [Rhodospirillales bacterium]